MIVDKDRVQKAKEKLGDKTPGLIAEILELQEFDEHSLKALCPIHREDTPSFIYNPKMHNYHCFGCGCNIDILDAYMMKGDTYLGAVEKLFGEVGFSCAFGERGVKTHRNYVYPQEVEKRPRTKVDAYFATRKISKETMDHFDVREDEHGNAVFNYYDLNDVLTMVKYRPSHKIDKSKGEAKTWCQKGADTKPLLYNMNRVNTSQPLLITEGECLTPDAQVMTPEGWVALGEYDGQQVLQVNEDFSCEFVTPLAYINKMYDGDLYVKRAGRNYASVTTAGHNLVYVDKKGVLRKCRADSMPRSIGSGYIPTVVHFDGPGIDLSDDQIALYLAVSADCTIDVTARGLRHCRFSVKKDRKFNRMKGILDRLGIEYFENPGAKNRSGYKYIGFRTPDWILSKDLPFEWAAKATHRQREFILEEMVNWDGNRVPKRNQVEYSSKSYHNAQVMQTIAHTCGYMSTIIPRRNDYGCWLKVSILYGKHSVSWQKGPDDIVPYFGQVCCVTVPSGMILVRQEHSITVTGNCDAMAAYDAGFTNAVSVPSGSQNHHWIEENWDWLDQFSEIIVCGDNDQAGVKMVQDVCPRLGTWRTKVVDVPAVDEVTGHSIKDLNELLYYRGKQAVMDVILNAKDSPIDSVVDLSDVEDVNISDLDGVYFGVKDLDMELFKLFYGTLTLVTGRPGCVSCDTEFFDGEQWKRIDQYEPGDKVLQYNEDGTTTLVHPSEYHKYPCDSFWKIETANHAVSQVVSDDHNLVYITSKGHLAKKSVLEVLTMHNKSAGGFSGRFITTFGYSGEGIDFTDAQIRVMCAVICDGRFENKPVFTNQSARRVRLNIKKQRKKDRLRKLLSDAKIEWEEHCWNRKDEQYTNFVFYAPMRAKEFDGFWYDCTDKQMAVIADEILFWDGSVDDSGRMTFSTCSKETADFIQFVFSSQGHRTSIRIDDRVGQLHAGGKYKYKSICYELVISHGSGLCGLRSFAKGKLTIPRVKSEDGFKYCFTVPSGMLVLRHNGTINTTSNSGKTSFLYQTVCNVLEQGRGAWIFSRELPDFMSKSWMNYLLAGPRNVEKCTSAAGAIYYRVSKDAKKSISDCYRGECYVYKNDWPNDIESIKESMEASARKYGSKLFLLDNLMTINLHSSDDNKYDKQTELVNWLIQFASKYNVAVILVAHPRKFQNNGGAVDLYDIGGSSNLVNLAHRTLSLRRVSKEEQEAGKTKFAKYSCVVSVTKDRLRGRAGYELGMFYDEACRRFFTNYEEYDRRYRWDTKRYDSPIPCPALDADHEVYGAPIATGSY